MKPHVRSAFLAAPAVLAIALTATVSACGSTAGPQSSPSVTGSGGSGSAGSGAGSSTASSASTQGSSGRASGTSTAAVPAAAKRVLCPTVMAPIVRLPDSAQPDGTVQPNGPVLRAEPIPAGFRPVAVVECVRAASVDHGVVRIDERRQAAISGFGRLLAALRKPSTPRPKGALPACLAPAYSWPWIALVSATGQVIHPVIPVGLCEEPIEPVLASLNSLHWIVLGTTRLAPFHPQLHGGPVHDITPGITVSN